MNKISMMMTMVLAATLLAMGGCKKEPENAEGPVEAAGEEVEEAAGDVGEATEEAGEETGDAVEDATD